MIRQAVEADVPACVEMVSRFQAEVLPDAPSCHAGTVAQTVRGLMASARGHAALLDLDGPQGLLLAHAAPSPWAPVLAAEELVWWIAPDRRGRWALRMLDDLEAWARGIGAGVLGLSSTGRDLGPIYARRGAVQCETRWLVRL
ncbi:MAG: hypothetical protein ACLFRU_10895 [Paracoccaceae bacterium]